MADNTEQPKLSMGIGAEIGGRSIPKRTHARVQNGCADCSGTGMRGDLQQVFDMHFGACANQDQGM